MCTLEAIKVTIRFALIIIKKRLLYDYQCQVFDEDGRYWSDRIRRIELRGVNRTTNKCDPFLDLMSVGNKSS